MDENQNKPELSDEMVTAVTNFSFKLSQLKNASDKLGDAEINEKVNRIQELFKEIDKKLLTDYSYDQDGM